MNKLSNFVERILKLPEEITPTGKFLVLPEKREDIEKLFTENRLKIIHLLKSQNPIKEGKLSGLMNFDTHKDIAVLRHIKIINIQKIDEDNKNNIVTLNKEIQLI